MKVKLLFNATALLSSFFTPIIANAELSKCSAEWINSCLNTSDSLIGSEASGVNYDEQEHQMICRGSFKDREARHKIFESLDKICIEICGGTPRYESISIKRNGPATGGHSCYVDQKQNMFSAFKLNQIHVDKLIEDKRIEADKLIKVDNQSDSFIYINSIGDWGF
nr:hypothetical protein GTC16762_31830 [Pigmentibacter ruber]